MHTSYGDMESDIPRDRKGEFEPQIVKKNQNISIVKEWQERPLEEIYAVVFMDAIHYHVRNEGRIVSGKYPDRMCRRPDRLSSGN